MSDKEVRFLVSEQVLEDMIYAISDSFERESTPTIVDLAVQYLKDNGCLDE